MFSRLYASAYSSVLGVEVAWYMRRNHDVVQKVDLSHDLVVLGQNDI